MSALSYANLLSMMRLLMQDNDAGLNYGLSDADCGIILNATYHDFMARYDVNVTSLGAAVIPAAGTGTVVFAAGSRARTILRATVANVPIERLAVADILQLQAGGGPGISTAGAPAYWAAERIVDSLNSWTIYGYPIIAGGTIALYGQAYPTDIDATHAPQVGDFEARVIGHIAAARGSVLLGRDPAFIAQLQQGIPEEYQDVAVQKMSFRVPRRDADAVPQ